MFRIQKIIIDRKLRHSGILKSQNNITRFDGLAFPLHGLLHHERADEELAEHVHSVRKMFLLNLKVECRQFAVR